LADADNDSFVVIAGSLYLVGEAMELLGLSPGNVVGERGLNEWTVSTSPPVSPAGKSVAAGL